MPLLIPHSRANAVVYVHPVISCNRCGSSEQAGRVTLEVISSVEDFAESLTALLRAKFVEPPVGWAVNGNGNYTCPGCLNQSH